MQELQEERKRLQTLEQTSVTNLFVDKTGLLVKSSFNSDSGSVSGPGGSVEGSQNDGIATTATLLAAEEQATGRRLRRREDKEKDLIPQVSGSTGLSSSVNVSGISSTAAATASRRKQVNNIYTYSITITNSYELIVYFF